MKITTLLFSFILMMQVVLAQIVPLGQPISTALTDDFNPSVSGNGKTLLYEVIYRNSNKADVMISTQTNGVWSFPQVVAGVNTQTEQLTNGGYFINHAGNIILFHSNRYKGIGGTDIWYTEKNANGAWSAPTNFAKPINSTGNEIDPSMSPDGKFLYFTLLSDKKTPNGLPCGKIMVSERLSSSTWKAPVELPGTINTGCECGGKLLSDNKTFLFSSMRPGGKGGLDFYKSTLNDDGGFTTPINYAFINTPDDDKYISIAAGGSMLYAAAPGKGKDERDIVRCKVPDDMQPEMVKLYQGVLKNAATQTAITGQITVTHVKTGTSMVYRTAADGSYSVPVLTTGDYDMGIFSAAPGFEYLSLHIATSPVKKYEEKNIEFSLKPLTKGVEIPLSALSFKDVTAIDNASQLELNRAKLLLRLNPTISFEIQAYTDQVVTDTVRHTAMDKEVLNPADSTVTYSNDFTKEEARYIYDYLVQNGTPASRLSCKGMGVNPAEQKKKYVLIVK
jgi:hypothetical protein